MPTNSFNIAPEDGWVQIATAPKFVYAMGVPGNAQYYLYAGTAAPATPTGGLLMGANDEPFWTNVTMTENLYARTLYPGTDGKKFRLDVITI